MPRTLPLIIAHRGSSAYAPENTRIAFRRAVNENADGIEFDVRLSKDGVPMVFHDSDLIRICGVNEKLSALSAQELLNLDAGSWFNEKNPALANERYASARIPTLRETLESLVNFPGFIYIELKSKKSNIEELAKAVCETVSSFGSGLKIIIKSFKLDAIPIVKAHLPGVPTASLFAPKVMTILRKEKRLVNISKELGANRMSLHFSLATRKLVVKAAKHGLPVTIWTADNPRWVKRAVDVGIDHLITNNPKLLISERDRLSHEA